MSHGEVVEVEVEKDYLQDRRERNTGMSVAGDVDDGRVAAAVLKQTVVESCHNVIGTDSFCFSDNIKPANLEQLRQLNEEFIKARNWDQFHSPRNVLLALVGEVGELAEIFQWKGEVSEGLPELSQAEKEHVGQEVSDILIYLVDFASRCRIDLPKAVESKMAANALKYPMDKSYGKANKYTDYT